MNKTPLRSIDDLASKIGISEATGVITSVRTKAVYIVTF